MSDSVGEVVSRADRRPLADARRLAEAFLDSIATACERVEIKGSIAREAPYVGDLEVVAIPRVEERPKGGQVGLFGQETERISVLWERIDDMVWEGRIVPLKPFRLLEAWEVERGGGRRSIEVKVGWHALLDERWPSKRLEGSRYFKLWLVKPQVQVDLFLATPETWGVVATIRTGPAEFSQALVSRWKRNATCQRFENGLVYGPDNKVLPTPEERDVFRVCGFKWVDPPQRRGWGDLIPRRYVQIEQEAK